MLQNRQSAEVSSEIIQPFSDFHLSSRPKHHRLPGVIFCVLRTFHCVKSFGV